jgi:hypothetical protein
MSGHGDTEVLNYDIDISSIYVSSISYSFDLKVLNFDIEVSQNVDPRYRRYKTSILKCNIVPDIEFYFQNFNIEVCNFDFGIQGYRLGRSDLRYRR